MWETYFCVHYSHNGFLKKDWLWVCAIIVCCWFSATPFSTSVLDILSPGRTQNVPLSARACRWHCLVLLQAALQVANVTTICVLRLITSNWYATLVETFVFLLCLGLCHWSFVNQSDCDLLSHDWRHGQSCYSAQSFCLGSRETVLNTLLEAGQLF